MKKTVNISLGGSSFILEDDAYEKLDSYIQTLKSHFASYPDAGEIISDIEARFAEQLLVNPGAGKIVTIAQIDQVIAAMGEPEQFGEDSAGANSEAASNTVPQGKRLYRNPDDVIIAGVASGLAVFFGLDPIWIRLIFGLSLFAGGFGLAVYVILWIILPEAKTETEKMRMRGERINLASIEQVVKERVQEAKQKDRSNIKAGAQAAVSGAQGMVYRLTHMVGKIVKVLGKVVVTIIGVALSIGAAIGVIGLVVAVTGLLFNSNSPYIDFPFRELAQGWAYYATVAAAFFVVFVPLVGFLLLGTSLLANKSTVSKRGGFALLGLWVVALVGALNGAFHFAPQVRQITETSSYFKTVSRELSLKDFTNIELSGAARARVHRANEFKVVATATQRDFEQNSIVVENGTLVTGHYEGFRLCLFCQTKPVTLDIYMPQIEAISASGASRVVGEVWGSGNSVELSGGSYAQLNASGDTLQVHLSGASRLELSGTAPTFIAKLSGASKALVRNTNINTVSVDLSGASRVELGNVQSLTANASGASKVFYVSAKEVKQRTSGASRVMSFESQTSDTETGTDIAPIDPITPSEPEPFTP